MQFFTRNLSLHPEFWPQNQNFLKICIPVCKNPFQKSVYGPVIMIVFVCLNIQAHIKTSLNLLSEKYLNESHWLMSRIRLLECISSNWL